MEYINDMDPIKYALGTEKKVLSELTFCLLAATFVIC